MSFEQNFAGKLASDSSRAVLATLLQAFGQCRAFHDLVESISEEQLHNHFINMVCSTPFDPGLWVLIDYKDPDC
jgi:hypothetical protein